MGRQLLTGMLLAVLVGTLSAQPDNNIDAVRIWKMTEVLELTEEQTTKFLPALQIHERELKAIQEKIWDLNKQSKELLDKKDVTQKDADALIKSYIQVQNEMHANRQEFMQSLSGHLSPEQQLKFLGFENRFRKELRDYMKDRRKPRSPGKGRRP